jgi:hypothetical protein
MIDRTFSAALTFLLLIGGTIAIGSALFGADQHAVAPRHAQVRVVQLERVVIVGKRSAAPALIARADAVEVAARSVQ